MGNTYKNSTRSGRIRTHHTRVKYNLVILRRVLYFSSLYIIVVRLNWDSRCTYPRPYIHFRLGEIRDKRKRVSNYKKNLSLMALKLNSVCLSLTLTNSNIDCLLITFIFRYSTQFGSARLKAAAFGWEPVSVYLGSDTTLSAVTIRKSATLVSRFVLYLRLKCTGKVPCFLGLEP